MRLVRQVTVSATRPLPGPSIAQNGDMHSLARRISHVTGSRVLNQVLALFGPLVLVRLLSVEQFGALREFLLYTGVLIGLATFSLPNALLYLVGRDPAAAVHYLRRIALAVAATSLLVLATFALIEFAAGHALLGAALPAALLYVLFCVNLDLWEYAWLARRRTTAAALYGSGRAVLRTATMLLVAWYWQRVDAVLWTLVALEALRCAVSALAWPRATASLPDAPPRISWREQLAYCVPSGIVVAVSTLNRSAGGLWLGEALGAAALAQLVVAAFVLTPIASLRNSASDVLLPELTSRTDRGAHAWLPLWQRSVLGFAMVLVPLAILLARFAEPFLQTLFSAEYVAAASALRWYCLMLPLACLDFAVVLRALGRTRELLGVTLLTLTVNLGALAILVPLVGIAGAAASLVIATLAGSLYLGQRVAAAASRKLHRLLPLGPLLRIGVAALLAAVVLVPTPWTVASLPGPRGAVLAAAAYLALYALLLRMLGLHAAGVLRPQPRA